MSPLFRELLRRELFERYQGSLLGWGWALLQPLLQLAVLALVFTHLLPARPHDAALPYAAFLALGLWPWQLFANAVARGTTALTDNAALIGKVAMPQHWFVLARVFSGALFDLAGLLLVLIVLALWLRAPAAAGLPVLVAGLALTALWALGLAFLLATLQVFVRDTAQGVSQILTLGFFLTPVLYDRTQLPAAVAAALAFNPLTAPIEAVRAGYLGAAADWQALAGSALAAAVLLLSARWLFRRARAHLEDFL